MLRTVKFEGLPSYEIGMERGMERGILQAAIEMVSEFNLKPEEVALKLKVPLEELKETLNNRQLFFTG